MCIRDRDITHSSVERVIIPDSCLLLDYMLHLFTNIISNLIVYPENMMKNVNKTHGLVSVSYTHLDVYKRQG